MVDFKNCDDVTRWLRGKPREVAIVIAARLALRAVPALAEEALAGDGARHIILATFRGMAAAWATAGYPAHGADLQAASASAKAAAADAAHHGYEAAAAVAYAAEAAAAAVYGFAEYAAAAYADAAYADAAVAYGYEYYVGPTRGGGVEAIAARATADAAASGDADAIDAQLRAGGHATAVAAALALRPLWPDGRPVWAIHNWNQLKEALRAAGEDWEVWTDWYEARLRGGEANEALEIARVMIPEKIWEQGPAVVNAHIKEGRPKPPEPPPDKPGPHIIPTPYAARSGQPTRQATERRDGARPEHAPGALRRVHGLHDICFERSRVA